MSASSRVFAIGIYRYYHTTKIQGCVISSARRSESAYPDRSPKDHVSIGEDYPVYHIYTGGNSRENSNITPIYLIGQLNCGESEID
jgi:hypothetical protein